MSYQDALDASHRLRKRSAQERESAIEIRRMTLYEKPVSELFEILESGNSQAGTELDDFVRRAAEIVVMGENDG